MDWNICTVLQYCNVLSVCSVDKTVKTTGCLPILSCLFFAIYSF